MMSRMVIASAVLALSIPVQGMAGEAYLAQVSAGPMTLTVPQPKIVQALPDVQLRIANLHLEPSITSVDLSGFPVATPPASGALADVQSTGTSNTSMLYQVGVQAGSIKQTGNFNMASLVQSGTRNGASIYQTGNRAMASVSQTGSYNRALVVQR
ncbi:hypothetical protein B6V75_01940 [Thioclava sp. F1Mire-8]|nr:hypothetical protein B6V75_01940 [Thioclava sp. F1Mire-8]